MRKYIRFVWVAVVLIVASNQVTAESAAMIRAKLFANPDIWRLSRLTSMQCYDEEILRYPVKGCISYVPNGGEENQSVLTVVAEHTFDGILYRDESDAIFRSYGHHGYGNGPEFEFPSSIDLYTEQSDENIGDYYSVFVADWWIHRIKRLRYYWNEQYWTDVGAITGSGLFRPIDLDYHNCGDFDDDSDDYLWVLNGNYHVKLFTAAGNYVMTYGRHGSGIGEFQNPTALVCGAGEFQP